MSRRGQPTKTEAENHTRTLRELLKRPENKFCVDCKRNDPRWASWNLGVFLCIRCSGIHRSMGTHISKVKSVDLDTWTPVQLASMVAWGNGYGNRWWEGRLKEGHVVPEHKMDSFIRSKYESKRWALEGEPPQDPSEYFGGEQQSQPQQQAPAPVPTASAQQPARVSTPKHQLLSTNPGLLSSPRSANPPPIATPTAPAPAPAPVAPTPSQDLFSLDFHGPPVSSTPSPPAQPKNVKSDILSLFNSAPAPTQAAPQVQMQGNEWGAWQQPQQPAAPSVGWGAPAPTGNAWANPLPQSQALWGQQPQQQQQWGQPQMQQPMMQQQNMWGQQQQQQQPQQHNVAPTVDLFAGGSDIWGGGAGATAPKKDDAFGDLWGGFK